MTRELTPQERKVLLYLAENSGLADANVLKAQVDKLVVSGGPLTMLELSMKGEAAKIKAPEDPLPFRAIVNDDKGEPIGELMLWTTDGYLSHLEYAWYTDEPPAELPDPSQIEITKT